MDTAYFTALLALWHLSYIRLVLDSLATSAQDSDCAVITARSFSTCISTSLYKY